MGRRGDPGPASWVSISFAPTRLPLSRSPARPGRLLPASGTGAARCFSHKASEHQFLTPRLLPNFPQFPYRVCRDDVFSVARGFRQVARTTMPRGDGFESWGCDPLSPPPLHPGHHPCVLRWPMSPGLPPPRADPSLRPRPEPPASARPSPHRPPRPSPAPT